jgi:hypothetical protein
MSLGSNQLLVIANQSGIDGNRISVIINEVFGSGGASVTVSTYDYNRYVVTLSMGFLGLTGGNNVDWATAAAALNAVCPFMTAYGAVGDYTRFIFGSGANSIGLLNGFQGSGEGQLYSPGVVSPPPVVIRKKLPQFIRGRL